MLKTTTKYLIILLLHCSNKFAFTQVPHLAGKVYVSTEDGVIKAEFTLSNIPNIDSISIGLNTRMLIKKLQTNKSTDKYRKKYEGKKNNEAYQYYLTNGQAIAKWPNSIKITYSGTFPVSGKLEDMADWGDRKANIGFNGKTMIASEESVWYPILYDKINNRTIDKYTFNIVVECKERQNIYVNGSGESKSYLRNTAHTFSSATPVCLLLYVGDYNYSYYNNIYFLNFKNNTEAELKKITVLIDSIKKYFEHKTGISYRGNLVLIENKSMTRLDDWLYVSYPAIVINNTKKGINTYCDFSKPINEQYIARILSHELAHYYSGVLFYPNDKLYWFFLEGLTEYMSLQYVRNGSDSIYHKKILDYAEEIQDFKKLIPINQLMSAGEINNTYRYKYVPLLLTVLERQIGREKMWDWITLVITQPSSKCDYGFFKKTLLNIGINENTLTEFETKYLQNEFSFRNVLTDINSK